MRSSSLIRAQRIEQGVFMEPVYLTGPFSFGDSWLGGGGNEVKICKAATRGTTARGSPCDSRTGEGASQSACGARGAEGVETRAIYSAHRSRRRYSSSF